MRYYRNEWQLVPVPSLFLSVMGRLYHELDIPESNQLGLHNEQPCNQSRLFQSPEPLLTSSRRENTIHTMIEKETNLFLKYIPAMRNLKLCVGVTTFYVLWGSKNFDLMLLRPGADQEKKRQLSSHQSPKVLPILDRTKWNGHPLTLIPQSQLLLYCNIISSD